MTHEVLLAGASAFALVAIALLVARLALPPQPRPVAPPPLRVVPPRGSPPAARLDVPAFVRTLRRASSSPHAGLEELR